MAVFMNEGVFRHLNIMQEFLQNALYFEGTFPSLTIKTENLNVKYFTHTIPPILQHNKR